MAIKQRFSNPTITDSVVLGLFAYNANNKADFQSITKVEIFFLDPTRRTEQNPDGRTLVQTIASGDVVHSGIGDYSVIVELTNLQYVIGRYIDVWTVLIDPEEDETTIENVWRVYPNLWYSTTLPIVYDFDFSIRPNKIRIGSKRWLQIGITPNVPNQADLRSYYENLAISADLKISIVQVCGDCIPAEEDLRTVVEEADVEIRDKCQGFYFLDTTDMATGIYDVTFKLEMGENVYISDVQQVQIFS